MPTTNQIQRLIKQTWTTNPVTGHDLNCLCPACRTSLGIAQEHPAVFREKLAPAMASSVARMTEDAFSFSRYGQIEWDKAARMMARRGYNAHEIEAILRSKITRWSEEGTAAGLGKFLKAGDYNPGSRTVEELIEGTPSIVRTK